MPAGRPPLPTKVLQMRGTFRADRHGDPKNEIRFAPLKALPPAPGFLDDVAVYEWNRVGPELVANELLREVDLADFTFYCTNVARVVACEKIIKIKGMTITTPAGFEQARPEVGEARRCAAEVRKFAAEFGMSPSSRARVRVPTPKADAPSNPFADTAANE